MEPCADPDWNLSAIGMPIEVDLGCARGHFLEAMARLYPNRFFLGVERLKLRYEKTIRRVASLENAMAWQVDSRQAVKSLLPKARIDTIHISFPDPWPKRRHHNRRLISPAFLQECAQLLNSSGRLRLMTDHSGYFSVMRAAAWVCNELTEVEWDHREEYPMTEFQKRFALSGVMVYCLALKKVRHSF
ncbi:MAG: hypothetical protein C5B47_08720 [Verrucomicrobia bacterium]|nr:MAG: hypothetical protein C5B47_08720 [Verrucomicrobiota bacterium]